MIHKNLLWALGGSLLIATFPHLALADEDGWVDPDLAEYEAEVEASEQDEVGEAEGTGRVEPGHRTALHFSEPLSFHTAEPIRAIEGHSLLGKPSLAELEIAGHWSLRPRLGVGGALAMEDGNGVLEASGTYALIHNRGAKFVVATGAGLRAVMGDRVYAGFRPELNVAKVWGHHFQTQMMVTTPLRFGGDNPGSALPGVDEAEVEVDVAAAYQVHERVSLLLEEATVLDWAELQGDEKALQVFSTVVGGARVHVSHHLSVAMGLSVPVYSVYRSDHHMALDLAVNWEI